VHFLCPKGPTSASRQAARSPSPTIDQGIRCRNRGRPVGTNSIYALSAPIRVRPWPRQPWRRTIWPALALAPEGFPFGPCSQLPQGRRSGGARRAERCYCHRCHEARPSDERLDRAWPPPSGPAPPVATSWRRHDRPARPRSCVPAHGPVTPPRSPIEPDTPGGTPASG